MFNTEFEGYNPYIDAPQTAPVSFRGQGKKSGLVTFSRPVKPRSAWKSTLWILSVIPLGEGAISSWQAVPRLAGWGAFFAGYLFIALVLLLLLAIVEANREANP